MSYTKEEVIEFVQMEDVKFIRLAFCDIFGNQKNAAIIPDELERAFKEGIAFDGSSIAGFTDEADVFAFVFWSNVHVACIVKRNFCCFFHFSAPFHVIHRLGRAVDISVFTRRSKPVSFSIRSTHIDERAN